MAGSLQPTAFNLRSYELALDRLDVGSARHAGPQFDDESKHFFECGSCGQWIDARDLGQVCYHEMRGHQSRSAT